MVRKGKRKLRSHGTESRKQERKLNCADSEKEDSVSKRSPTAVFTNISWLWGKKPKYAQGTVLLKTLFLIKTQGILNERDTTKENIKVC